MKDSLEKAELVAVARAVKTRGLRGELVADLLTDFPERFEEITTLVVVSPEGNRKVVDLEDYWFQKDRIVLKLKDYDSIDASKSLVGSEFAVPEADRVQLEAGSFYEWELQDSRVITVNGDEVGKVVGVLRTGGVEMLEVLDAAGRERLVPMAESIVKEIDTAAKRILIDPPDGLLDL